MIIAILIDDELYAQSFLQKLIERHFSNKIIVKETCNSIESGVLAIRTHKPDLVFLDLNMPDENGFALFRYFNAPDFEVIITSAYAEFAIEAIRHPVLDYLLKPISYFDLRKAIEIFETHKAQSNKQQEIKNSSKKKKILFNKIALPTQKGYELIELNTILFCRSESNYCNVVLTDGRELLIAKTLKYIENLISNDLFMRIHKSYLVNLNFVEAYYNKDGLKVTLTNGLQLPVSVRKKEQFLKAILPKK